MSAPVCVHVCVCFFWHVHAFILPSFYVHEQFQEILVHSTLCFSHIMATALLLGILQSVVLDCNVIARLWRKCILGLCIAVD